MGRKLGAFESALTLSDEHAPLNVVAVLRLATGPSPEALRWALDALRRRHPLLRARITKRGGGYVFDRGRGDAVALRLAERDGSRAWVREVEAELGERIDLARAPIRCVYLASGSECEIVLTFHHAIMDAASAINLCRELLAASAAADAGHDPEIGEPLALLPAAEELFPPACQGWRRRLRIGRFVLRQLGAEVADRWRAGGAWHPPPPGATRSRILCFELSEAETASLVRRSRRRRLTLHSLFDAAILLAVARRLYPGRNLPLRHLTFANLRPYLRPPVAAANLGACFAMLRFSSTVAPDRGLWDLAQEINARVHAANRRGDKYAFSLTSAAVMRHLIRSGRERMAATAISYTGAVRLGPSSRRRADNADDASRQGRAGDEGRFPVQGLHAFVASFRLGPEYTAQVRLWAGRIWWDILYLEPDLDEAAAQGLADEIRSLLVEEGEPVEEEPS